MRRIDVHHHIAPPTWLQAVKLIGADDPVIANWSVEKSIDDMDEGGVATAVLSSNVPQVRPFNRDAAVPIARESNEYAELLATSHPGRFGVFAMLPLPHIDESLGEIAYAIDTLKVDGVGILTNYGDKWNMASARKPGSICRPTISPTAVGWSLDRIESLVSLCT